MKKVKSEIVKREKVKEKIITGFLNKKYFVPII
jgi:hypothetical protein